MRKQISIPNPADYDISPRYGFIPDPAPLTSFPNPYYKPWDDIAAQLPTLIKSGDLANHISKLPTLSADRLDSEPSYRRAYVTLAFTIHAHIWSTTPPTQTIPPQLSEPFLEVCSHLGMQPVISYAGLCTWNWQLLNGGGWDVDSMEVLASFTGTRGEAAFYHVPVLTEYEGGRLPCLLLSALDAASSLAEGWQQTVIHALNECAEAFVRMGTQMGKLYSRLDPQFFYHEHRPFMAGGNGMEEKGLPRGMVFQRSDGSELSMKLVGGSAVQSPLFPFLDAVLGVEHADEVFQEMRAYMPSIHRDFLARIAELPSLRSCIEAGPTSIELKEAYNKCMAQLRSWRGKHIALVSKYIVQPARAEAAEKAAKVEVTGADEDKEWELQGTGGSALIPFLKCARDETVGVGG